MRSNLGSLSQPASAPLTVRQQKKAKTQDRLNGRIDEHMDSGQLGEEENVQYMAENPEVSAIGIADDGLTDTSTDQSSTRHKSDCV